jgi:hypothetical protein
MHERRLNVARQRHREAVHVDFPLLDTLWLEEDLMSLLVRKTNNLILKGRTVSRSYPSDLSIEQRRLIDVGAHEVANPIVCVNQVAVGLRPLDRSRQE